MSAEHLHHLLDIRVPVHWYWQALRYGNLVSSAFLLTYNFKYVSRHWSKLDAMRALFFTAWPLYVLVQETEQLGQPVLVWRAPWLFFLNVVALIIIFERGQPKSGDEHGRQATAEPGHDHD